MASELEVLIAEQILLATGWCRDRAKQTQQAIQPGLDKAWAGIYEDNGSCVDIIDEIHSGQHFYLQVKEKRPLTLTDGVASIEASLTSACRNDLHARYPGKCVSSASPNSVIAVRKYTIRYTPYGPRRSQLTLILHAIDWHGEGERGSTALKPITSCEQVDVALQKLRKTRLEADRRCFLSDPDPDVTMAPPDSRADEQGVRQSSSPSTQLPFGTQIQHPYRNRVDNDVRFLGTKQLEPVLAGSTRREELGAPGAESKGAQQARLLSLLDSTRLRNAVPPVPPTAPIAPVAPVAPVAPSAGGFARANTINLRGDTKAPAATSRTPILPGRPDRFRNEPTNSPRPTSPNVRSQRTLPARSSQHPKIRVLDTELDIEPQRMLERPLCGPTSGELAEEDLDDEEPEWLQNCRPTWGSATAPGKQRALLSKEECWQKPEAGYRFPDANIPIGILRELKKHASINAVDETVSPIVSDDEDEELPDADLGEDVKADTDTALPTSQVSWSSSPAPEPPKRLGLPPDSELANNDDTSTHEVPREQVTDGRKPEPILIESSNETAVPPSSPPLIQQDNNSDEEMELEVPRGLGDSPSSNRRISVPMSVQPAPVVQVKETPNAKGTIGVTVPPGCQQTSSGESKDTSSTSVVYCTYKDQNSSGDREAIDTVAGRLHPASAPSAQGISGKSPKTISRLSAEALTPGQIVAHLDFPATGTGDVLMEDAPLEIPCASKPSSLHHETITPHVVDRSMPLVLAEPSPISAQRSLLDLSSSGERALELTHPNPSEPTKSPASIPEIAHMKRKLDTSPLKKSNRLSKRREIKFVGFGDHSPPRDIAAELRQARKESLNRFWEDRRSDSISANPLGNERQDSTVSRITPLTETGVSQASAEPEQPHSTRKSFNDKKQGLSEHIRQNRSSPRASETNGPEILLTRGHHSPSVVHHIDSVPKEMDIDDPFYARKDTRSLIQNSQSAPLQSSQVFNHAAPASPTIKEKLPHDPISASTQRLKLETIFQNFKTTYPEYTGSTQHFVGQCKQMHKLDLEDKMVPKWQWDDFIIRNRTDYKDYILQCSDNGEDPEPYYRYYKDNIRNTLYSKGVIKNRETLLTALKELETPSAASPVASPIAEPAVSPGAEPAKMRPRKSLPWGPSQSDGLAIERSNSSSRDHSRLSLPAGTHKTQPIPHANSPLRRTPLHHTPTSRFSAVQEKRKTTIESGASTPISRTSFGSSAFSRQDSLSKIPTESTGDVYRDFVFAFQRTTSLTGNTSVDPDKLWPTNLAVRPKAEIPRSKGYDVLDWKDDL